MISETAMLSVMDTSHSVTFSLARMIPLMTIKKKQTTTRQKDVLNAMNLHHDGKVSFPFDLFDCSSCCWVLL